MAIQDLVSEFTARAKEKYPFIEDVMVFGSVMRTIQAFLDSEKPVESQCFRALMELTRVCGFLNTMQRPVS